MEQSIWLGISKVLYTCVVSGYEEDKMRFNRELVCGFESCMRMQARNFGKAESFGMKAIQLNQSID